MAKKKDEGGAPAYMALYTSLMIVMLAFFILLNTMANKQEAGFNAGIGDVQNAFGLKGGFGLFRFTYFNSKGASQRVFDEHQDDAGEVGLHENTTTGKGGGGNSDEKVDALKLGQYIRVSVPYQFESTSTSIPGKLARYLEVTGTGLALFDHRITIRCYSGDTGKPEIDREISAKRAASIMRYLNQTCHIPLVRMASVGYADRRYFQATAPPAKKPGNNGKQAIYFYIYKPASKGA